MVSENRLNEPYPDIYGEPGDGTKERILLSAIRLFSQRGLSSVSIRDIADEVKLRPASIYNHFESKEDLWEAVLERTKSLYLLYFERLDEAIAGAETWKQVIDYMFAELFNIVDINTYYAFSLVQAEQFWDQKAYQVYKEVFFEFSIDYIKKVFDMCIEKGWAKEFDTGFMATAFMQHVLVGIIMRKNEDTGREVPYDTDGLLRKLYNFIYETGKKGSVLRG